MSSTIPGLYIAGGAKDAGKTTVSLGILSGLKERVEGGVAFMKPLGQKTTMLSGESVGQDSYLVKTALGLQAELEVSAPFSASSGASQRFLETGKPRNIPSRIRSAFSRLVSESGFVVVEGTGHPGVGAVFGLSNGAVARKLQLPVVLVLDAGIGRTIDSFALCSALFESEGVHVAGLVINRMLPSKQEKVRRFLGRWAEGMGLHILGFVPYDRDLEVPSLVALGRDVGASSILASDGSIPSIPLSGYISGFGSTEEILCDLSSRPGSALIISSSRTEVLEALLARGLSGSDDCLPRALMLCGEGSLERWIVDGFTRTGTVLLRTEFKTEKAVNRLERKIYKIEPDEEEKLRRIIQTVRQNLDFDLVMETAMGSRRERQSAGRAVVRDILRKPLKMLRRLLASSGKNGSGGEDS